MGTFKSQLKNTDYYWNDYKDDSPLHSLFAHSSFNWKKLTSFIGTFKIQLEKTVQYPNDFKDYRTLHHLWGHSNYNWKRQFSIEMISKITELYILWREIQIPTEKDSSVLKWLQRWQDLTLFEGTFKFRLTEPHIFCWNIQIQLKKTVQYWNDFKDDGPEHPLWWHSNPTEKHNSVSIDLKDHKTLHPLWGHSNPNWKSQIIIEMITKMT